jgi:motility quorum-sensing regulator / GCU-specific mRNA interferase toxin
MEKLKPSYPLKAIQVQMQNVAGLRMTFFAMKGILQLDWDYAEAVNVVKNLKYDNFYTSMTTHEDHRIWQDVYHAEHVGVELYVKFQRDVDGYFTISFKRLGNES